MKKHISLLILLILFVLGAVRAQDIQFKAKAPDVVNIDENFKLTYTVNSNDVGNFVAPKFTDFNYSGPSRSTRRKVQVVNGNMRKSVETSFSYYMQPKKAGTFEIGPARIEVNGETYKTNPVTVKVVEKSGKSANKQSGDGSSKDKDGTISDDDIFLRVHFNKSSVYKGEHLLATVKLYTRLDVAGLKQFEMPSFNGFWSQKIKTPNNIRFDREKVNGDIYKTGTLSKVLLFPQRSGEFTIDPAKIEIVVRQRVQSPSFFDSGLRNISKSISSGKKSFTVQPLPEDQPLSFSGTVGDFNISAKVDKKQVKANKAINFTVTVSGNGNLKLVDPFKVNFPADFDTFDPEVEQDISNFASGARGKKKMKYLLIPRYAGTFTIPSITFSYFNPKTEKYITEETKSFEINVAEGDGSGSEGIATTRKSKQEVEILNEDIRYIKRDVSGLKHIGSSIFSTWVFYMGYSLPVIVLVIFLLVQNRRRKLAQNEELVRNQRANKISRKRLKTAAKHLKDNNRERFYEEILKALWGYISDKLNITFADLTRETIFNSLKKYQINQQTMDELQDVIETCEYAQYAPAGKSEKMGELYNKTSKVIRKLENSLKKA